MKEYFAYVRVSTAKQGQYGVSLQEQREAITRYAERYGLHIKGWFEERQTAAKQGRPIYISVLKQLQAGSAFGLIIHKIDRGARNLRDWADLGEMIDAGIDVRFVTESIDLQTRGGRLSADIQAVVAADYIRNLREEARKGFYGRLRQGLYPLAAPVGYVDQGKGNIKTIDPVKSILVSKIFELYGSGRYTLRTLIPAATEIGLRNRNGRAMTKNSLAAILRNPFYTGSIKIRRTDQIFAGKHQAIVHPTRSRQIQLLLQGRKVAVSHRHHFLFRQLVVCNQCRHFLIGERQKGHQYYRCHTSTCPEKCTREEEISEQVIRCLSHCRIPNERIPFIQDRFLILRGDRPDPIQADMAVLQKSSLEHRLQRLVDTYLESDIDRDLFLSKRDTFQGELRRLKEKGETPTAPSSKPPIFADFLALIRKPSIQYRIGTPAEKENLLRNLIASCQALDRQILVVPHDIFLDVPEFGAIDRFHFYVDIVWQQYERIRSDFDAFERFKKELFLDRKFESSFGEDSRFCAL